MQPDGTAPRSVLVGILSALNNLTRINLLKLLIADNYLFDG